MSNEIHGGLHTCKRCEKEFHQSMFVVGSGYCEDCYFIDDDDELISPIQSQINSDAATIKRLMDDNERLSLELEIARGRNRELVELLNKIKRLTANDRDGVDLWNMITEALNHKT